MSARRCCPNSAWCAVHVAAAQEISELIGEDMKKHGVNIIRGCVPSGFKKDGERSAVTYKNLEFGFENTEVYDTV